MWHCIYTLPLHSRYNAAVRPIKWLTVCALDKVSVSNTSYQMLVLLTLANFCNSNRDIKQNNHFGPDKHLKIIHY